LREKRERESHYIMTKKRKLTNANFSIIKLVILDVNGLYLIRRFLFLFSFPFIFSKKSRSTF